MKSEATKLLGTDPVKKESKAIICAGNVSPRKGLGLSLYSYE